MSQEQKSRFYGKVGFLPLKVSTSAYFAPPPWPRCWFQNKLSFIGFSICWLFILFGEFFSYSCISGVESLCVSRIGAPPLPTRAGCPSSPVCFLLQVRTPYIMGTKGFKQSLESDISIDFLLQERIPYIMGTRGFKLSLENDVPVHFSPCKRAPYIIVLSSGSSCLSFRPFCLCFSPFYSFRFIPAQILLPRQGCPLSHGRSTRSSSSGDCSWTDCKSSGRLPSYSERFTLEFLTLTIKDSLHRSWIVCT